MEEGDDLANYESDDGIHIRRVGNDGVCVYLIDGKCSIYDRRPNTCKNWNCYKDPRWYVVLEQHLTGKRGYYQPKEIPNDEKEHD